VLGGRKSTSLGKRTNWACHSLIGDFYKAVGNLVEGHGLASASAEEGVDLGTERFERCTRCLNIKRLLLAFAEDLNILYGQREALKKCEEKCEERKAHLGEVLWQQTTEDEVGVGDSKRSSLAVARRTGVGACRLGADVEETVAESEAAERGHGSARAPCPRSEFCGTITHLPPPAATVSILS
jgi:hypothetical protein